MPNHESTNDLKNEARRAAEEIGRDARRVADEATDAVENAKHRGSELLGSAYEKGSEFVDQARQKSHEFAGHARDEARRIYREGERRASDAAAYAEDYYDDLSGMVRRNPGQALGIAVGVGFLLGLIVSRR